MATIVEKLQQAALDKNTPVNDLLRMVKFVAAKPGPKRISRELDNEHTPFVRRGKR